jgi:hypothetical protein
LHHLPQIAEFTTGHLQQWPVRAPWVLEYGFFSQAKKIFFPLLKPMSDNLFRLFQGEDSSEKAS